MHIPKEEIPVKIDVPGAVARQCTRLRRVHGSLGAEYFTLTAAPTSRRCSPGSTTTWCHSAHWGYLITVRVVVTYRDGGDERCADGDVFHWPPGTASASNATPR